MLINLITLLLQTLLAFLIGTVIYDFIHYFLHICLKSKNKALRALGKLHIPHHRFFPVSLKIDKAWIQRNLLQHVLAEYVVQSLSLLVCALFLPILPLLIALFVQTCIFFYVCYCRGMDGHHKPYSFLPSYRSGIFVTRDYHALHHVYPNQFYASYIKCIDYLLGTGTQLAGKCIAMTGASGALGLNMKRLLEKEGASVTPFKFGVDYTYDNYEKLKEPLAKADILLLCHGAKEEQTQEANCDSFVSIIELFKKTHQRDLVPLEVWAVGSEIEFHPCFGIKKLKPYAESKRNYARYARSYFHDRDIQYRHMVHSAFTSRMGPGLMSAKTAAFFTLFLIKRGLKYVPVSYMGFAYLNYFRFLFNK
jgi:monoglucosyldiacylglycerol epimerase